MINSKMVVETKLTKAFELLFQNMDFLLSQQKDAVESYLSGTTLTIVFTILDRIYCAYVGDSRSTIIFETTANNFVSEDFSKDHKPTDMIE